MRAIPEARKRPCIMSNRSARQRRGRIHSDQSKSTQAHFQHKVLKPLYNSRIIYNSPNSSGKIERNVTLSATKAERGLIPRRNRQFDIAWLET